MITPPSRLRLPTRAADFLGGQMPRRAMTKLLLWLLAATVVSAWQAVMLPAAGAQPEAMAVVEISGHTLRVPKGYVSSLMGYAGYLQIRALLPCLTPETTENAAEFHRNDPGRILVATLNAWDSHYLEGRQILNFHIADSQFVKDRYPEKRKLNTGPFPVGRTDFLSYKDIMIQRDLFVLSGSHPLFLVDCSMRSQTLPFPTCDVREKIWGDVRLYYWYARTLVDQDVNNGIAIDARLRRLLSSFLLPTSENEQPYEGGSCK